MDDAVARVDALRAVDGAIDHLGVEIVAAAAGSVELALQVEPTMANGHGIVHGGYLFLLADTAFAYCCASLDRPSVTRTADIAFLAPASVGARVTARAEVRLSQGRTTICDVRLDADGKPVAEFRGHGVMARG
jgi:acyl-CoA thioesterase